MKITKAKLKQIIKEELSQVLNEDEGMESKILALIADGVSPDTRFVANLKMNLGKLGFDENDMVFNEDYPASLSFGSPFHEHGEWVLRLEGKCIGRGIETCLVEN